MFKYEEAKREAGTRGENERVRDYYARVERIRKALVVQSIVKGIATVLAIIGISLAFAYPVIDWLTSPVTEYYAENPNGKMIDGQKSHWHVVGQCEICGE